jgi:hypothetical protein
MTDDLVRVVAFVSGAAILASAAFAVLRRSKPAAVINGSLALLFIVIDTPQLVQFAFDRGGYIAQFGGAAVPELALNAWGAALGLFSLVCSWVAFARPPLTFWLG